MEPTPIPDTISFPPLPADGRVVVPMESMPSMAQVRRPGERVAHYTIEALLGVGGMGQVYRALDGRLGRRVAFKLLSPACEDERHLADRLVHEARAAAALSHPNVVSIYDVGEWEGQPYIAMELVSGETLRDLLAEPGDVVPLYMRLRWLIDVAYALDAAHRAGLVHRDIKPENVMVRDDGVVKVLDFGIACPAQPPSRAGAPAADDSVGAPPALTESGNLVGTTRYMAPEQIRCEPLDGHADQFAWAVTAYEALTGQTPWGEQRGLQVIAAILHDPVRPPSERCPKLPPHVDRVLLRALAKHPCERFTSMAELAEALDPGARDRVPSSPSVRVMGHLPQRQDQVTLLQLPSVRRRRVPRRWRNLVLGALALALAAGGSAGLFVLKRLSPSTLATRVSQP